jgi:hypothetical protein
LEPGGHADHLESRDLPRFALGTVAALETPVRSTQEGRWKVMKRMSAFAVALATFLTAGVVNAALPDEIQAPRAQDIQAPRAEDIQAPRGDQEIQAPRGDQDVQVPRS